jgi:hypothetical protein
MELPKTIPQSGSPDTCSNYQELLRLGMDHCQFVGKDNWTDYNLHDPGVTILQQLCFALTDLAYRTDFNISDLLAVDPSDPDQKPAEQPLYTGDRVLTCSPVTIDDYRKALYDRIDGVKNAWLNPIKDHPLGIRGLYEVLVEMREDVEAPAVDGILRQVRNYLRRSRNLAEDFDDVRLLQPQKIHVEAAIEIAPQADPSAVLANVLFDIQCLLIPFPKVQIIDDVFRDKTPDEVWNGPLLEHGALEKDSLKELTKSIDLQRIAQIMLKVDGVKRVKRLKAGTVDSEGKITKLSENRVVFQPGFVPRLDPPILDAQPSYTIDVELEGGFKTGVDARAVWLRIRHREADMRNDIAYANRSLEASSYRSVPTGDFRNVKEYFSIQQQFPATYGLSKYGIANNLIREFKRATKPEERQARVRQLRAYLLFFEQPMADYLAQLANIGRLFSLDESLDRSYFSQRLANHPVLASDPEGIVDVLVQREAPPKVRGHYVVSIVDARGEIIFSSRRLQSLDEAQSIRQQMLESGQHAHYYRINTTTSGNVQVILHSTAGAALALGHERHTSVAHAHDAIGRWSKFVREHAGAEAPAESPVRIFPRENLVLHIVNDQSEVVLSGTRLYTTEERDRRLTEILAAGSNRRNYRIRPAGDEGYTADLHNARHERVAEGEKIFSTEADAVDEVHALAALLRRMATNESDREKHVRRFASAGEIDQNPRSTYWQGLDRLWRHEDRDFLRRRNKILNHLLARFSERFDDDILERLDLRPFGEKDGFFRELIDWKIEFLRNYVQKGYHPRGALGGGRGLGSDNGAEEDPAAMSGLERRVSLLLGLHRHESGGEYSAQTRDTTDPGFSYLEKYVWPLKPEVKRENGDTVTVSRERIAGPWPKGEPDLNDLHHNFVFSSADSSILAQVLAGGLNPESYTWLPIGSEYQILFFPPQSAEAIEIHRVHSPEDAKSSVNAFIRYLHDLKERMAQSYAGERMHVVEHILLRPHGPVENSSIHISKPEAELHLLSAPVKRSEKEEHLDFILRHGQHEKNYQARPHSSGKYLVVLVHEGRPIAQSQTFASEQDAKAAIPPLAELVGFVYREPDARKKHVHAPIDDFYSNRVSVFLPNWPARFQNDEFKLYAQQLISENAPAHVAVDFFWLAANDMADFERLLGEWKSLKLAVQVRDDFPEKSNSPDRISELNEASGRLKTMIEAFKEKQRKADEPGAAAIKASEL